MTLSNTGITGRIQSVIVQRRHLRLLLDIITIDPTLIFSVRCRRRTDLFLAYPPRHDLEPHGGMAHVGDHSVLRTRQFIRGSRHRIVLQPRGTMRTMIVKRKLTNTPTKHWQPVVNGRLRFNPAAKGLYRVHAMYPDRFQDYGTGIRYSRHGQHRTWCFIDLLTTTEVRYRGILYKVIG